MDFKDEDKAGRVDGADSALSAEFTRILDNARKQLEDEFRRRLDAAVQQANDAAAALVDSERERATVDARTQLTAQLRSQFEQTLQHNTARLEADFEDRINASVKEWEAEKARLLEQTDIWRAYAEGQRQMAESHTQAEILGYFLDRAEPFAPNLAVYVARPDGLALWKTRGGAEFPQVVSKETIDPDAYFKTIVVRDKIVAAVCARQPLKPESLDFLSGALSRAIEAFGMRLQSRTPVSAS